MLLPVSQTQVHLCSLYRMRFSKVWPVLDPEGRRSSGDGVKTFRQRGGPEGKQAAQRVTSKNNGQFPVFFLKFRQKRFSHKAKSLAGPGPHFRFPADCIIVPGSQVQVPVEHLECRKDERDAGCFSNQSSRPLEDNALVFPKCLDKYISWVD